MLAFSEGLWLFCVLSSSIPCGRQNNGPKDVHCLITGTCEYVTLHDRKDFTDVIALRILRKEDYHRLEVSPIRSQEAL